MEHKVLLILCDGMRPDAMQTLDHPFYREMRAKGLWVRNVTTVMPSVTLPCHMSLFHSVDPTRHGTVHNVYAPQVRPITGLCDQLRKFEKTCAMFYNWEQLRDIARPDSMMCSEYRSGHILGYPDACTQCTDSAIDVIAKYQPDFTFLYFGYPDEAGHDHGWMTDEYMESLGYCWDLIEKIARTLPENYDLIVTADHGGHDRMHGTDAPEDMQIPLLLCGPDFAAGELDEANIKDIAPTVAALVGVPADCEWEGRSLL